jgi:hypothetical protein
VLIDGFTPDPVPVKTMAPPVEEGPLMVKVVLLSGPPLPELGVMLAPATIVRAPAEPPPESVVSIVPLEIMMSWLAIKARALPPVEAGAEAKLIEPEVL